jgi:hypothetical protein
MGADRQPARIGLLVCPGGIEFCGEFLDRLCGEGAPEARVPDSQYSSSLTPSEKPGIFEFHLSALGFLECRRIARKMHGNREPGVGKMQHLLADKIDERTLWQRVDSPLPFVRFGSLTKKTFIELDRALDLRSMKRGNPS